MLLKNKTLCKELLAFETIITISITEIFLEKNIGKTKCFNNTNGRTNFLLYTWKNELGVGKMNMIKKKSMFPQQNFL